MESSAGIWGQTPVVSEEDLQRSHAIDEQLRRDRIDKMKNNCSVLILSANTNQANESRHVMACSFAQHLGMQEWEAMIQEKKGQEVVLNGTIGPDVGGILAEIRSFACSNKDKSSKMKLAAADPSVMVYVVSADCESNPADVSSIIQNSLKKALVQMLKIGQWIGNYHQTAVCIVLSNCRSLRDSVEGLLDDAEFMNEMQTIFPSIAELEEKTADDVLLKITTELENAAKQYHAKEIRTVAIDDKLHSLDLDDSQSKDTVLSLSKQMLQIIESIQQDRISEVQGMDMSSKVWNTAPAISQSLDKVTIPPTRQIPSPSDQRQSSNDQTDHMLKLALFGILIAILTMFLLRSAE